MRKEYPDTCITCGEIIPEDALAIRTLMPHKQTKRQAAKGKAIIDALSPEKRAILDALSASLSAIDTGQRHYERYSSQLQCESCADWEMPEKDWKERTQDRHDHLMKYGTQTEYDHFWELGTDYIRQEYPMPCWGCGRPLVAMGVNVTRVCSDRCAAKARRRSLLVERRCDQCHHKYMPKRKDSKFCSTKCRVASHRANKAA